MPRISPTDTETPSPTPVRGVIVLPSHLQHMAGWIVDDQLADALIADGARYVDLAHDRGARGVAASAQPTETQTAARDSAAAVGGTCQANTDAAQPQSPSGVGTCAQDAIASGGDE